MGFRAGSAASWPVTSSNSIAFRANTDTGLVFVVGSTRLTASAFVTGPLPPAFRPLAAVTVTDTSNAVGLSINPDGTVTTGAGSGFATFRTFYLTTVTNG